MRANSQPKLEEGWVQHYDKDTGWCSCRKCINAAHPVNFPATNKEGRMDGDVRLVLEAVAAISLWRDTYSDGPEMMDTRPDDHIKPEHVRAARRALGLPVVSI
jgi:hypothetical protein